MMWMLFSRSKNFSFAPRARVIPHRESKSRGPRLCSASGGVREASTDVGIPPPKVIHQELSAAISERVGKLDAESKFLKTSESEGVVSSFFSDKREVQSDLNSGALPCLTSASCSPPSSLPRPHQSTGNKRRGGGEEAGEGR